MNKQRKLHSFPSRGQQQFTLCRTCFRVQQIPPRKTACSNRVLQEASGCMCSLDRKSSDPSSDPPGDPTFEQSEEYWTSTLTLSLEKESQDKWKTCESCKRTLYLTSMSKAQIWRRKWYCHFCYDRHFLQSFLQNKLRLQKQLLFHGHLQGRCSLCLQFIDLEKDDTIFEHMNPFQKENEITQLLRQGGRSPAELWESCQRQGILVVHTLCAQVKTHCEAQSGVFTEKKLLKKKRKTYEISNQHFDDIWKQKKESYDRVMLPVIQKVIRELDPKIHLGRNKSPKSPEDLLLRVITQVLQNAAISLVVIAFL